MGKGGERKRERVTVKAQRGRGCWRGGDWSRSNRGWGECLHTGRAIRSCQGPMSPSPGTPILPATSRVETHSFVLLLLCVIALLIQFPQIFISKGRDRQWVWSVAVVGGWERKGIFQNEEKGNGNQRRRNKGAVVPYKWIKLIKLLFYPSILFLHLFSPHILSFYFIYSHILLLFYFFAFLRGRGGTYRGEWYSQIVLY